MIGLNAFLDAFNELVDLAAQSRDQGATVIREQGEQIPDSQAFRVAENPGQLSLKRFPPCACSFEHVALRIERSAGIQDRLGILANEASMLSFQQREHLAVVLQLFAKRFNDLFEGRCHQSMISCCGAQPCQLCH